MTADQNRRYQIVEIPLNPKILDVLQNRECFSQTRFAESSPLFHWAALRTTGK